jgi:hypothetical protein
MVIDRLLELKETGKNKLVLKVKIGGQNNSKDMSNFSRTMNERIMKLNSLDKK